MDRSIMAATLRGLLPILLPPMFVVILLAVAVRNLSDLACLPAVGGSSSSTFRRHSAAESKRGVDREEDVVLPVAPYDGRRRRRGPSSSSCEEAGEKDEAEEEECAVCLSGIEEGEEVRELKCRHLFHRRCLDRWLLVRSSTVATCPLCRCRLLTPAPPEVEEEEEEEEDMMMLMAYLYGHSSWFWPSSST